MCVYLLTIKDDLQIVVDLFVICDLLAAEQILREIRLERNTFKEK